MACNSGLLWLIYGPLYGIVACYLRLRGVPGRSLGVHTKGPLGLWGSEPATGMELRPDSEPSLEGRWELTLGLWRLLFWPCYGLPGKPVAYNYGLLWLIYGLLYGIVTASCFRLLGFPGLYNYNHPEVDRIWAI